MLRSLLSAHGVNPAMITVFIDGYFEVSVPDMAYLLDGYGNTGLVVKPFIFTSSMCTRYGNCIRSLKQTGFI